MKLCKDCKYCEGTLTRARCVHPINNFIHVVTGEKKTKVIQCTEMREKQAFFGWFSDKCGPRARLFKKKK